MADTAKRRKRKKATVLSSSDDECGSVPQQVNATHSAADMAVERDSSASEQSEQFESAPVVDQSLETQEVCNSPQPMKFLSPSLQENDIISPSLAPDPASDPPPPELDEPPGAGHHTTVDTLEEQKEVNERAMQAGAPLVVRRAPVCLGLTVPKLHAGFRPPWQQRPTNLGLVNGSRRIGRKLGNRKPGVLGPLAMNNSSQAPVPEESADPEKPISVNLRVSRRGTLGARRPKSTLSIGSTHCPAKVAIPEPEVEIEVERDPEFVPLILWEKPDDAPEGTPDRVEVPYSIAKFLREHQREGTRFVFECITGMKQEQNPDLFQGQGCILADDMGLGKTLQSIAIMFTCLTQSMEFDRSARSLKPIVKKVIVVCPVSLVKNWEKEIHKWLGDDPRVACIALSEGRDDTIKGIRAFAAPRSRVPILIIAYDTFRNHKETFYKSKGVCDLLICDEAHRLKNEKTKTNRVQLLCFEAAVQMKAVVSQALDQLDCPRRILLSGTPMQNDLEEFYAMASFCNPVVFGSQSDFRRKFSNPILQGREPGASEKRKSKAEAAASTMSSITNMFVIRRTNALLSAHLPPKVMQIVAAKLTPLQKTLYNHLLNSKAVRDTVKGKRADILPLITTLKKLVNHPMLVFEAMSAGSGVPALYDGCDVLFPPSYTKKRSKYSLGPQVVEDVVSDSGKMLLLDQMLTKIKSTTTDRIVIVSNFTQTLDLIQKLCTQRRYPVIRLDGSVATKKRQVLVDQLNDLQRNEFVFLLSSKAGGCGLNLVGANRLILFDPDWNPANDKQAAGRIWRDGQKKRCYIYRFVAAGSIEEKIYQRQLSKEALQDMVAGSCTADEEVEITGMFSSSELKEIFKLQDDNFSILHEHLACERCGVEAPAQPEQIGNPPAESDLANWAHHHSNVTVPDQVMASLDANASMVSFVFSCSVAGKEDML